VLISQLWDIIESLFNTEPQRGESVRQWWWVGLSVAINVLSGSPAAADGKLEFSLEEVEGTSAPETPPPASAPISNALGELRWSMNKDELLKLLKAHIEQDFEARVKAERDVLRQDALYQEAKDRYERLRQGFVTFDTRKNGWDVSPMADEFRRGTGESMLVVDDRASRDYYFFVRGQLWKWYRELKPSPDAGYDQVADMMRAQYGKANARQIQDAESGTSRAGLSWTDVSTRATLIRRGADTCIVFEARAVLAQLAELRKDAVSRDAESNRSVDAIVLSDAQREAWRRGDAPTTDSRQPRTNAH
jgi:hypothetical protein